MRGARKFGIAGKLVGIALAVCGLAIIVTKMPATMWWLLAGVLLILTGGKIFIS